MTKLRKVLSIMMVSIMTFTLIAVSTVNTAAASDSKEVTITKTLSIADGITTPSASFTFAFAADTAFDAATPAIANKSVNFTSADVKAANTNAIEKETTNIFAGVTYPHAGEFFYTISETAGTTAIENGEMAYDTSKYRMQVIVAEDTDGTLYISAVNVATLDDQNNVDQKVGSQPSDDITGGETFKLFTNTFTKNGGAGVDPGEELDSALTITHKVAGTAADKSKYFTYNVTLTQSPTARAALSYTGKVGSTPYTFTTGQATTVTLKHGETIDFEVLPAGTKVSVVATGVDTYTPSYEYISNGGAKVTQAGSKATTLTASDILVGEYENTIVFTHTRNTEDIPPMGIDINNLPFILFILVSMGGFAFYIVNKRRTRTQG
ncbi:pilin isopeptide linkage protein [Breznakia sp. PF5-3]|uniref:DUF7601 domain-containing protein n=1 Tax=unclassified Breznakia TaxID=2623764 RepID=UPI0024050C49|nr:MULTISPECIES: FctA domain-containing protein [unclassified Breznakia]MDL2276746.1 hypothetical protein [Breznakia sp. OttesenSCG-928-G09]MDF9825292.1 pilin isopeptide linkage protein [Breznakia sp. PM6-1]MDF9836162.1 pilin isopeptide linkage protein [Breznakia sp. PF5-3]MDF9837392.1 pilin isopeptide linkage protein [Breznakia sp. PFB2-8]MDF9859327.1 pilin isopeptide linkage protein [Breznakia sp. PH5-24]